MGSCASCGHALGGGRFCHHCGAPVSSFGDDWRTDTAERKLPTATSRPAPSAPADPRTPPAAVAPPPPPRYPLYADEVDGYSASGPLTRTEPTPDEPAVPVEAEAAYDDEPAYDYDYAGPYDEERRSPVAWILAMVAILVVVGAGWWFLVRGADADTADDDRATDPGSQGGAESAGPGPDVARTASAAAPSTAPPNLDVDGKQVSYDASNMLDGVPTTAWRTDGDATGLQLTFTLPGPTELVQVGMINGYAKQSTDDDGRTFDWYRGNRRVNAVVWTFDDGTKVRQQLGEDTRMQLRDLDAPVTTTTVVATLVRVSAPGEGDAGRNYTAVSEVALVSAGGS